MDSFLQEIYIVRPDATSSAGSGRRLKRNIVAMHEIVTTVSSIRDDNVFNQRWEYKRFEGSRKAKKVESTSNLWCVWLIIELMDKQMIRV